MIHILRANTGRGIPLADNSVHCVVTSPPYWGLEPCILAGCPVGGVVLDPFCGSGTTLKVAERLGRRGVGLELNPAYIAIARRRTAQRWLEVVV